MEGPQEAKGRRVRWSSTLCRGKRREEEEKQGRGRQVLVGEGGVGRERRANLKKIPFGNLSL